MYLCHVCTHILIMDKDSAKFGGISKGRSASFGMGGAQRGCQTLFGELSQMIWLIKKNFYHQKAQLTSRLFPFLSFLVSSCVTLLQFFTIAKTQFLELEPCFSKLRTHKNQNQIHKTSYISSKSKGYVQNYLNSSKNDIFASKLYTQTPNKQILPPPTAHRCAKSKTL